MSTEPCIFYPAEFVGHADVRDGVLRVNDVELDVSGMGFWSDMDRSTRHRQAMVFVRRASGVQKLGSDGKPLTLDGYVIAEVLISLLGDRFAQEELDGQNAEAERILEQQGFEAYKAYWVAKGMDPDDFDEEDVA